MIMYEQHAISFFQRFQINIELIILNVFLKRQDLIFI